MHFLMIIPQSLVQETCMSDIGSSFGEVRAVNFGVARKQELHSMAQCALKSRLNAEGTCSQILTHVHSAKSCKAFILARQALVAHHTVT